MNPLVPGIMFIVVCSLIVYFIFLLNRSRYNESAVICVFAAHTFADSDIKSSSITLDWLSVLMLSLWFYFERRCAVFTNQVPFFFGTLSSDLEK